MQVLISPTQNSLEGETTCQNLLTAVFRTPLPTMDQNRQRRRHHGLKLPMRAGVKSRSLH